MSHASCSTPTPTAAVVGVDSNASGQEGDRKQESDSIEKALVIKLALLEDEELEEGELGDDDDDDAGVDNKIDQPVLNSTSEEKIQPSSSHSNGSTADESLGKSIATIEAVKKPKEIPSLFDLKTTKPKSMKRLVEEKGKMSFPKYIDHDRIDDGGFLNYNGQENMAVGMWSGYSVPNDDYESSDCDAVPENEFSVEIQQMLNRSATGATTTSYPLFDSDKSPRGPYDSPSEDEENDESIEFQPPNKLQKVEEVSCVSYGLVMAGSKKVSKKQLVMASEFSISSDNNKTMLTESRTRKRGEQNLSDIKSANEPHLATEKRRLVDTPMEERPQCKFYFEGKCKKGVNCPFNHDMKRLTKFEHCHFYMSGQCSKGNDCAFSHELKSSGEEDDRSKTDALMPKKRKALLGSPPAKLLRMLQPRDKKKIPSLFDIQINADGPNAKEILQSAARRSVMRQLTNPKPGLLGVAPPMIAAAGMIGPVRTGFPISAQAYFENLTRLPPHEKIEDAAQEILKQRSDFTGCHMDENLPAEQVNFTSNERNESLQDRDVFSSVEVLPQNLSTDFSCSSSMYCSTSVTLTSSSIEFVTQDNFSSDLQSAMSESSNSHYQTISAESSTVSPSAANPLLFLQHDLPLASSTEETDTPTTIRLLPMAGISSRPQIVGGVDINHLPPKQRELYLRMFANQKQTDDVSTDKPSNRTDEEIMHTAENTVSSHSSADLLKLLIPVSSQSTTQSLDLEAILSNQSLMQAPASSGSSFSINQMLAVICGGETGLDTKQIPLSAARPAVLENAKPAESVFVVSGSHLRGPYQLQCVALEGGTSTLPSHIDPTDPKYTFDPRVQKHKDEVIMHSPLKPEQQMLTVLPVEPIVKVHTSFQRRDPRLAKKEAMTIKEETVNQLQQQQLEALSAQSATHQMMSSTSQQNLIGAVQQSSSIQVEGAMQHGNVPVGGTLLGNMPLGGMQQSNMPLGSMQQSNMLSGGMQQGNMPMGAMQQSNMPLGGMQQSNMPLGGMQQSNMPMGGMQQSNMPSGGMQQDNMPMGAMQQSNMPLGGMQQSNMPLGGMQQSNMPLGSMQQSNMPLGGMQQSNMPLGGMQQSNMPMGGMQQSNMPLGGMQQSNMLMGGVQQSNMPLGGMQQSNMPMGGMQQGNMPLGGMQQGNMPMGAMQQSNMPLGGMQQSNMPMGGMQQGNMPVGGIMQGKMLADVTLQGILPMQHIMAMGGMQQPIMQMRNTQQRNMHVGGMQHSNMGGMQQENRSVVSMHYGNLPMGGMQRHVNMPFGVRIQNDMSVRPMLQGGMQSGCMQQSRLRMNSVQQGDMADGSNEHGGMSIASFQLRGAVQGSRVPMNGMQHNGIPGSGTHQTGMSVNGMQKHMNMPIQSDMRTGGLLPQPSGGFLPQRGLIPPFIIHSQASVINCFPQSVNTQLPVSICNRVGMMQHDMVRPESISTNHDRLSEKGGGDGLMIEPADVSALCPAAAHLTSICSGDMSAVVQSNPVFVQPLLSVPLKTTSVIAGPSDSPSLQPTSSSLPAVIACDDMNHQHDIVSDSEQHQVTTHLSPGVDVFIDNKDGCNQRSSHCAETLDDASLTSNVERTLNYGQDHRFRIKKAQINDFEENSSDVACNSGMLVNAGNNESNVNARKTVVRNRDKLEFRSPLADMGDGGSSLSISGYNQPPNKKYQQLAEENNLRRSALSKAANKDSGKQKQQSTSRQVPLPAAQQELLPSAILNLQPTPDALNLNLNEPAHSVQSVKDMFKSIDPTASPFC